MSRRDFSPRRRYLTHSPPPSSADAAARGRDILIPRFYSPSGDIARYLGGNERAKERLLCHVFAAYRFQPMKRSLWNQSGISLSGWCIFENGELNLALIRLDSKIENQCHGNFTVFISSLGHVCTREVFPELIYLYLLLLLLLFSADVIAFVSLVRHRLQSVVLPPALVDLANSPRKLAMRYARDDT